MHGFVLFLSLFLYSSSILLIFFFIPVLFLEVSYPNTELTFEMCCNTSSPFYITNNTDSPICHNIDEEKYICKDFQIFNITGVQDVDTYSYEYIILLIGIVISFVYYVIFTYAIYEEQDNKNIKQEKKDNKAKEKENKNKKPKSKNPLLRLQIEEEGGESFDSPTITPLVTPTVSSDNIVYNFNFKTTQEFNEERKSVIEDTVKVEKSRSKYLPIISILFCLGSIGISIYLFVMRSKIGYNLLSVTHCTYNLIMNLIMLIVILLYMIFSDRIISNFFNFYLCYVYVPMMMCLFFVFAFVVDKVEDYIYTYKKCCDVPGELNLVGKCSFLEESDCNSFSKYVDAVDNSMPIYITILRIIFLVIPVFSMVYYGIMKRKSSMLSMYLTNHRKVFPEVVA